MRPADAKSADVHYLPQLLQFLNRPIAFHRCFVTLTESITTALMLSQALYWQQRTKNAGGWWYKSYEEWTKETGLKRRELEAARIKLRALDVLEEKRTGSPAKLWYRINLNALEQALCGVTQPITLTEILSTYRGDLMRLSKVGLMNARRAGVAAEYMGYAEVLESKGLICPICQQPITQGIGKKADYLAFDYIIPLSQGGTHTLDNLHPCHVRCKGGKGDEGMSESASEGLRKPNQSVYGRQSRLSTVDNLDCLPKPNQSVYGRQIAPFYTETTTEISTETTTTTTPNPSSSDEGMAETEPERSRSRGQDEQNQDQDGSPETAARETHTEKPVSREETPSVPTQAGRSDTPTETPKTVSQEVTGNDPQPEPAALTPLSPEEPLHDELVSHVSNHVEAESAEAESAEAESAEAATEHGMIKTLTCNTQDEAPLETADAATPDETAATDALQTAQEDVGGEKPAGRYLSPALTLTSPPGALQADLTRALRAGVGNVPPTPPSAVWETAATAAPSEDTLTATRPAEAEAAAVEAEAAEEVEAVTLVYPAKLTELERADMAVQVRNLPAEIAQQMLDVIEAKIKAAQIKTNPAAVCRGLVRKYRADPNSFDPSPGFHVAENRRQRAEAEARLRAAEAVQRRQAEASVTPSLRRRPAESEGYRYFREMTRKILRGR